MPTDASTDDLLPESSPTDAPDSSIDTAASASQNKKSADTSSASSDGNVKETIESILVAFILAFIFRAYVVEAFVIPTGSMAPTLLGAHMRFQCTDCGYKFTVNYSGQSVGDDVIIPSYAFIHGKPKVFGIVCPNCGLQVPENLVNAGNLDTSKPVGDPDNDATAPPVYYGDRILVLKYAFLLNDPRRWDVVVFKTPHGDRSVPAYTMNYIKRLVGKPFESLKILDGDVYVAPYDPSAPDAVLDDKAYKIQRKTPAAQSDLWRIVYDNDFLPHRENWTQPWEPEIANAGWALTTKDGSPSREFTFDNPSGEAWIHFNPLTDKAREPFVDREPLTDWLAYDITQNQQSGRSGNRPEDENTSNLRQYGLTGDHPGRSDPRRAVGDLRIGLTYSRTSGDGPLKIELEKRGNTVTAELTPDQVKIVLHAADGTTTKEVGPVPLSHGGRPVQIDFANFDYQAILRIDGNEVLKLEYDPDVAKLTEAYRSGTRFPLSKVRIGAAHQTCTLSHLSLWRDIYYTNDMPNPNWGSPDNPVNLGRDEFFVLGDNSIMSGDARVFSSRVSLPAEDLEVEQGRVPGRFMLGRAFFVYWPAGYRPMEGMPGLIPNFSDMRFIH